MDSRAINGPAAASRHYSSDNAEIDINHLVAAMAGLNSKILRLREEVVAFKEEKSCRLPIIRNATR